MLLQPHSEPVTRKVTGHHEGEGMETSKPLPGGTNWLLEFHNIFDPPGMPVERETLHQIELLPNAEPHYRR